ncbi:MAG: DoxX family protein [Gillisia sp.]
MDNETSPRSKFENIHMGLLILRIGIALLMLTHGIPKLLLLLSGDEIHFLDFLGLGASVSLALAVFAEVVCAILLFLGLATRWASIPLIVTMLVAIFKAHGADPFNIKELAVVYLLIFLTLLVAGGGKYSLQQYLSKFKE